MKHKLTCEWFLLLKCIVLELKFIVLELTLIVLELKFVDILQTD